MYPICRMKRKNHAFPAQLGFAASVEALIDTFAVRSLLELALFGRWTWWPGGVPRGD